uniref:Addiction module component n=1 Tax=Candidatus Kentrum sp. FW TaxID=2126338 RepID=A0A450SBS4_9GAMM|nr:MAG: Putative addiction module component [Candidatus Kentron sp. FW]
MTTTLDIQHMSRAEKLQVMESLWDDLSRSEPEVKSPAWHEHALRETEARVAAGRERIADWEVAKRELRKRFE